MRALVHPTYDDELAWLADQVLERRPTMAEPLWSEIGVLTRDNSHAADVFDALTAREIPVEIVGLKGLMRLPEVSEVVSTLALLQDLTANADLLNLLTGPRWAIGPRDLALLGRGRAALAGRSAARRRAQRRRGARSERSRGPTRPRCSRSTTRSPIPGTCPTPRRRRARFALLSGELRVLRDHAGEPLLDLVRRIVDITGIDVELASSVSPARRPGATTSTCS